jgi:DNA helicase II / ATP-dependent DNA helicase PcrA
MKSGDLTVSTIEAYQRCPRQYAYNTLYDFGDSSDGYRIFWKATQQTLDILHKQLQNSDKQPTEQEIQALYSQHWQELGGDTTHFRTLYEEHGHEVAELLRRELLKQAKSTWQMHSGYTVPIGGKAIQVTIDRVEAANSTAEPTRFVRTRFGKRRDKPSAELREFFYALAYRQLHPGQELELHNHNMSTGEIVPIKLTAKKEEKFYEEVEQSLKGLEEHSYPAQPAEPFRCPTCPFFLICPA